jgi:hypothetical protein
MVKKKSEREKKEVRPKECTIELGEIICARLMEGEGLSNICKDKMLPTRATVYEWLASENELCKEFANKYMRAREIQADYYADEIIAIADESDSYNHAAQRLKMDARKWYASKLKPKKYGDKLDVTTGGEKLPQPTLLTHLTDEQLAALEALAAANDNTGGEMQA